MALSTTQINQAYIAILGRPAIETESIVPGNASVSDVASSLIADKVNKGESDMFTTLADKVLAEGKDTNSVSNADFVESLYLTLLNRDTSNDAEGKEFWLNALNNGASRKDLVDSFTNAVIAQKAANTQDYQKYAAKVAEQSAAFVESLYTKLLGRSSDEAGKAYWSGLIADGASYADVVASFANAAFIQGKDTADGVTIANKLEVADYATTNLTSFSKLATEQDIEEIKARLEQAITNTKSNTEAIAEAKKTIDSDANTYKTPGSVAFTTKADDKLGLDANGAYSTTKATNFNGTLNLDDDKKGTIQKSDAVNGNPDFAAGNILTVNVTGTSNKKTLNIANDLPTTISGVNNLEIKASTATVSGDISERFTNSVTIDAGYTSPAQPYASDITVKHSLSTYNAGAKADKLTVESGASITTVNMGAGNDTISLKAGNGQGAAAIVTNINAGAGNDTIELATVQSDQIATSGDYTTIKSITGIEVIKLTGIQGDATSGAQISYDAIKGNKAFNLTSTADKSGDLTIKAGNNTDIDVSLITNGEKSGANYINKVATLTISDVKADATITLRKASDGSELADVIKLAADAGNVTINGIASGDKLDLKATNLSSVSTNSFASLTSTVTANKAYFVNANKAITTAEEAASALSSAVSSFASTAKALIAFNNGGKSYLFAATGDSDSTDIKASELTLIGIVDNKIDTSDKVTNGVIEFV
ncbi:MAG: DUF4214 domain-containing protein [Campylobacter sp.]|nr:DUF4214 domain-containing protein [Campylobacter sp.]